jgi:hypothetical protein
MAAPQNTIARSGLAFSREADASNGWETVAQQFIAVRSMIGADTLREWSRARHRCLAVDREFVDEGENHYFDCLKR